VFLILFFSKPVNGQKSFGIELSYLTGFQSREVDVLDDSIDFSMPHGSQLTLSYSKRIKESSWVLTTAFGGKYINMHGKTSSQLKFSTNSFKVNALFGTRYNIHKDLDLGFQFVVESNRDLDEISYLKADLWRYYLCLETAYNFQGNCSIAIKYWRSLSPNEDVYLLFNSVNQVSIGVNYYFHEI
tara:strand:- start:22566 stop:23120 length:555 start_codon:yes stop_codon:yes gene_type:complete